MSVAFVVHHHDQRRHDIEHGNGDDEHEYQASIMVSLMRIARQYVLVALGPTRATCSPGLPAGLRRAARVPAP